MIANDVDPESTSSWGTSSADSLGVCLSRCFTKSFIAARNEAWLQNIALSINDNATWNLWQCNRVSLSVRNPIIMMKDISLEISHLPLYSILHNWPSPPLVQDSFNFIFAIVVVVLFGIYTQWHVPLFERHSTWSIHIQFYNMLGTWSNCELGSQDCRTKHPQRSIHNHADACTLCNHCGICKCSTIHSQSFRGLLLLLSLFLRMEALSWCPLWFKFPKKTGTHVLG